MSYVNTHDIMDRAVEARHQGLPVENAFAGILAAGTLVYVSDYNTTDRIPKVDKADASHPATWVVVEAIPQSGKGRVAKATRVINVDTSGYAAIGDEVYLSATAGASAATGVQHVGWVEVKSASVGVIQYNLNVGALAVTGASAGNTVVGAAVAPGASRALAAGEFGVPIQFVLDVSDAATGDATFTGLPYKIHITQVDYLKTGGAGNASNTAILKQGANAITDAMNNAVDAGTDSAATLDDAYTTVAAGVNLVVSTVRSAGNNAFRLTITALRIA